MHDDLIVLPQGLSRIHGISDWNSYCIRIVVDYNKQVGRYTSKQTNEARRFQFTLLCKTVLFYLHYCLSTRFPRRRVIFILFFSIPRTLYSTYIMHIDNVGTYTVGARNPTLICRRTGPAHNINRAALKRMCDHNKLATILSKLAQ